MSSEEQSALEQRLVNDAGLMASVARHFFTWVTRPAGLLVICGPAGAGKTTLGELLRDTIRDLDIHFLGDLRMPDEIQRALAAAQTAPVIAVVRSGQSEALRRRWHSMGIESEEIEPARVVTVTIRKLLPAVGSRWPEHGPRPLIAEILAPDGAAPAGTLVDQARMLISAGTIDRAEAIRMVPEYSD